MFAHSRFLNLSTYPSSRESCLTARKGWRKSSFLFELRQRHPEAIEFLVEQYGALIKSVLSKHLRQQKELLEECFNDVLLAVWNNPEKFDNKKSEFKNWLCAIAKYRAIDTLRREMKHKSRFISLEDGEAADWVQYLQDSQGCKEEEISKARNMKRDLIYSRISRGKKKIKNHIECQIGGATK